MKARSDPIYRVERLGDRMNAVLPTKNRMNAVTTNGFSVGGLSIKRNSSVRMLEIQENRETMQETLEVTASAKRAGGLRIDQRPDGITIDTGKIKFTIAKNKPFGLFDSVSADGKPVVHGGEVSYLQLQGREGWDDTSKWNAKRFMAGKPES